VRVNPGKRPAPQR